MARLIAQTGHTIDIPSQGVTFGSDAANGIMIPAVYGVAPSHFAIWQQPNGFYLRDSGSGYGLWVNGQPVRETCLTHGDIISAGQLHLTFEHALKANVIETPSAFMQMAAVTATAPSPPSPAPYAFAAVLASPPVAPAAEERPPAPPVSAVKPLAVPVAQQPPPQAGLAKPPEPVFEVLPAAEPQKTNFPSSEPEPIRLKPSERIRHSEEASFPKPTPPPWLAIDEQEPPHCDATRPPTETEFTGITGKKADQKHREKMTTNRVLQAAQWGVLVVLVIGALTARHWAKSLGRQMENFFCAVFTNESAWERPQPPVDAVAENTKLIAQNRDEVRNTSLDVTRPHAEVAPRFIWDQATTVFSLGFPQIEIFYLNEAQRRGLPLPKRHCAYLEKHFGLKILDLERLTSVQDDPTKPGIVVITTQKRASASDWINEAQVHDEGPESLGPVQILRYRNSQGVLCGVVALDDRNFAMGDPKLLKTCLQRKVDLNQPNLLALWPDFMRKQLGAFAWTVKVDDQLASQLSQQNSANKGSTALNLGSVSSFAVRFGGEPPSCECFAVKEAKASQEAFTDAATVSLKSMTQMITNQADPTGQLRLSGRGTPEIRVSRTAAAMEVPRGEVFVNIFMQGFYQPAVTDEGPLKALAQARTLAHAFNLARSMDAPESRRVHTVEEALAALQRGMKGSGRASAMEFQIPEMDADELRSIRKYLTFADGYLACRPDLDSLPDDIRTLAEEGRNRLNAETVLSLCPSPPGDKVVQIPDLAAYVRRALTNLKTNRGPMALFGMPLLNDEELKGILRYIIQAPNGKLGWKPGELAYNAWQAKANPKALRDASTLASIAGAAHAAGAKELLMASTVDDAIQILAQGVKGSGQFNSTTFRCKDLSANDLQNAANLLELDHGLLKLKNEPASLGN